VPAEFSEPPDPKFLASLQPGSVLWVTGVCDLIYSETLPVVNWPIPIGLRLLLRGPSDVEVITIASWWTLARLETALGIAAGVVLIFLAWVSLLRRQVTLRSTQLADEMRARRDATVEFATTLRERNRLAADLHDTTEQSLTGLAFQLEATGALQNKAPERSQHHLALARQLLNRSREDLRRSIWNLRATDLESKTLAEALQEVAANRSEDLAVRIGVTCEGPEHALPESVAGNLLLFAQEGITNALKHARPTQIDLQLRFTDGFVSLTVRDDGVGFEPASADGPKDGHFGLQGMRERMKRLGGVLKIESSRGQGTLITATVRSEIPRFSPTAG
jgi:signal transduction histidine kinase